MLDHDKTNALEKHTCPNCGHEHTHKFQWDKGKFWVGKVKNKFIAWCYYMLLQSVLLFVVLFHPKIPSEIIIGIVHVIIIVSAIVTFIFMLAGAIDIAVGNAKISAELKASILKEIKENLGGG